MNCRLTLPVFLLTALVVLTGCDDAPFEVETPPEMIELHTDDDRHFVAMTADGVVIRSRATRQGDDDDRRAEAPRAEHDFWVRAIRERMRTRGGYALLDEVDVQSADGTEGTRLEFGRDHEETPYVYWLTLFVTDDRIHVIEAGGRQDRFEGATEAVEQTLETYRVLH